jgi:hypothetical protein
MGSGRVLELRGRQDACPLGRVFCIDRVCERLPLNSNAPRCAALQTCVTRPQREAGVLGSSRCFCLPVPERTGLALWTYFGGRKVSHGGHFRPVNSLTWCDDVLPSRRAPRFRLRCRRIAQRESAGFNTAPEVEGSNPSSPNTLVLNLRDERPYVQWDRG